MNFTYTEEHEMIRQTARDFAENTLAKTAAQRDLNCEFFTEELKQLAELGFFGVYIPEEYGGAGMDTIAYCISVEEISRVDASAGVVLSVTNSLAAHPILKFGSEAQKRKYLIPLAQGKFLGGFCLTEPGSGSDAASMKTTAVRDGEYYVLNGSKNFITSGLHADVFIIGALTDKSKGASGGVSAFIMERDNPGITYGPNEKKLGIRSSDTSSMTLEDCRLHKDNLLGEEGMGFRVMLNALDSGRLGIASQALGIGQAALEEAVKYSKVRHQFGKPISSFQAIQFKIADMAVKLESARLLTHRAAFMKDNGMRYTKEAAMAKLAASQAANWIADQALQIHGGYGYTKDYPVERFFRDARITEIYEGTSEIQRLVISKAVLNEY